MAQRSHSDDANNPQVSRRKFLFAGAAGLGLAAYSGTHARHEVEVVRRRIALRNLPPSFEGFRIAQISDIHYDEYTEPWMVRNVVQQVNALRPDLVALTGDYISKGPMPYRFGRGKAAACAAILAELTCPLRYCILGNHDAAVDPGYVTSVLRDHGLPVLIDEHVPITRGSDHFWLCGSRDPGMLGCRPEKAIPGQPDAPVVYMVHEPDFVSMLVQNVRFPLIDLMLSGHTHGGQVRIPFVGPLILPPGGMKYVEGLYRIQHMQLYVNRGIGTVGLPFRLNCPPEITEITLTGEPG